MLYRKIETYMRDFFVREKKKALLITGARQVGKITYYPIYMLMFVQKNDLPSDTVYKIDLAGLQ